MLEINKLSAELQVAFQNKVISFFYVLFLNERYYEKNKLNIRRRTMNNISKKFTQKQKLAKLFFGVVRPTEIAYSSQRKLKPYVALLN